MNHSTTRRSGLRHQLGCGIALALLPALPLAAQERAAPRGAVQVAQASDVIAFDIPAQTLASALTMFGDQAGLQIAADTALLAGRQAPRVVGTMTAEQALAHLLSGSGIAWRFADRTTLVLSPPEPGSTPDGSSGVMMLDPLTVEARAPVPRQAEIGAAPPAYAGGQVASAAKLGLLGNRDVFDTPFNITSYTARTIEDQQARSMADVIANNDPSVRAVQPAGANARQVLIRGFLVSNQDVSFNGLPSVAPAFGSLADMAERLELLRGPAALLSGMSPNGSVGGTINIVPRRAEDDPLTRLTTSYISDGQFGGHVDIGRRYGAEDEFGIRLNGAYRNGDTVADDQSRESGAFTAGLDYRGESLRLSLDIGYQDQTVEVPTLLSYFGAGDLPAKPDPYTNWFQRWSFETVDDTFGALRAEFDLAPDWTVYAAAGGRHTYYDALLAYPSNVQANGDFITFPYAMDYRYFVDTEEVGLRGRFNTGWIAHDLALSGSRFYQETESAFALAGTALNSNIFNPVNVPRPATPDLDATKANTIALHSVALADALSLLDDRVQLILGVRYQEVAIDQFDQPSGALASTYEDSAVTPAVGLVVKPWETVSLYANYVEGLERGDVVGNQYANAGEVLPPFVTDQVEVGVKVDWQTFGTTLAAFQTSRPSGVVDPATNRFSTDGEQRNRGLELNVFGEPVPGIRLLGGAALIDAELTATEGGLNDGNTAPGVPTWRVNLNAEWDTPFLPGFTVSGRVIHTSAQYIDAANRQELGGWTRFDIGARYRLDTAGGPITLRLNVENLFDIAYWETVNFGAALGAPRTILLSTSFEF